MSPALVWDCSVAIAMAFEDERDDHVRRIFETVRYEGALVPAHWPMEVVNVLRVAERLAQERGLPLASKDNELVAAARRAGIKLA